MENNSTQRSNLFIEIHHYNILGNASSSNIGESRQENRQQITSINKRINPIPTERLRRGKRLKYAPLKGAKYFISSFTP